MAWRPIDYQNLSDIFSRGEPVELAAALKVLVDLCKKVNEEAKRISKKKVVVIPAKEIQGKVKYFETPP